jgi:hypothetical protein
MVRPADLAHVDPLPRRMLRDAERFSSWNQARSFVGVRDHRARFLMFQDQGAARRQRPRLTG